MDKKRLIKSLDTEDLKGFEEFIEGQSPDASFLPKGVAGSSKKNEAGFEHFTFLSNDSERLTRLKLLLSEKLPFSARFDQSNKLIEEQREELEILKKRIFELSDLESSAYRKSLREIFDSFFGPSQG